MITPVKIFTTIVLVFLVVAGTMAQGITGFSVMCQGYTANYSYNDDQYVYDELEWSASGGSVSNMYSNPCTITWNQTGAVYLTLRNNGVFVANIPAYPVAVRTAGTISANTYVCPSTNFTIFHSGADGDTFELLGSPAGQNNWTTRATSSIPNTGFSTSITANTDFKVMIGCKTQASNIITVNVFWNTTAGTVSADQTICSGSTPAPLMNVTLPTGGNLSYQWQSRTNIALPWSNISGATGLDYSPSALTQTTYFSRKTTGCVGPAVNTPAVTVTVDQPSVGGTASVSPASICNSGNASVSISGQTGTIQSYYYSIDNSNWTPSASSSIPVSSGGSDKTYYYYATVKNGVCPAISSLPTSHPVYAPTVGGATKINGVASVTMCGSGSVALSVTGQTGSLLRYESRSRNNGGTWSGWATTTANPNISNVANVDRDFEYRAVIQNGTCAIEYANVATATVYGLSAVGTVTASASICSTGSITVSVSSYWGNAMTWQSRYSDNGGTSYSSWSPFSTTVATSQNFNINTPLANNRIYQFRVVVANQTCNSITSSTPYPTATVFTSSTGAITPPLTEAYGVSTGSLTLGTTIGTVQKWQSSTNGGSSWADIANTTSSQSFTNLTTSTQYRAVISNGVCTTPTAAASVNIYVEPSIVYSGTPSIAIGNTYNLSANATYSSYQWLKDDVNISGATNPTYAVSVPGIYKLQTKGSPTATAYTTGGFRVYALGEMPDTTANRVVTTTIRKSGVVSGNGYYASLQDSSHYTQSISYLDGVGRPIQNILIGQSPLGKDIVVPHTYDSAALESTRYLPYVATSRNGFLKATALKGANETYQTSDQYLFYQNTAQVAQSTYPYAQVRFENSPLGRVTEKGAPGADWQLNANTAKSEFHLNTAADNVRQWTESGPTGSNYLPNQLAVNKTIDENGNSVLVFTDKLGRTILKRVQMDATVDGISTPWLETYFVYNIRGSLALQVPPKAVAKLNSGTAWSTSFRDQWCFVYVYDSRSRLVEKKTPDATWVYYGYDPLDRLVLTQDGNLRAQNKWTFLKYDSKGRIVMTGLYTNTNATTRAGVQAVLDALYANTTDPYFEQRGTALHGYTNATFPTANAPSGALEVLGVNYYDTYDFDFNGTNDFAYTAQGLLGEGTQGSSFGLPTGSKKLILNTANWLYTYQFYDARGRAIQTRSNNHLSLAVDNLTTVVYDFEGKVLLTKSYHNAGGTNQTTVVRKTTYDFAGRPVKVYQNINNQANDQLVARYNYNELGQVVEKNLHLLYDAQDGQAGVATADDLVRNQYNNESALVARNSVKMLPGFNVKAGATPFVARITTVSPAVAETNGNYLQSVDYRYNIRGWLTSINNAQLSNDGATNNDTGDYFGMEMLYNQQDNSLGNAAYFNGNISATKWKSMAASGTADQKSYKFTYDKSDKLTVATYQRYGTVSWNQDVNTLNESQSYDHNGNILGLVRNRIQRTVAANLTPTTTAQTLDNLTYTYTTGNQLAKVDDSGTTDGFNNQANTATEYTYTTDGNMASDANKGIASITYNVLGKPQVITYTGSPAKTVTYTYDAGGSKLKSVIYDGTTTVTTDYVGGFVYENNALSFFSSPEGRVVNGPNFEYQYAIADHQGNTRVVFSSQAPAPVNYTATFEDNTQTSESSTFQNYPTGGNRSSLELFDHTDFSGSVYNKSQLLNGGNNSQVGLAKSLRVYPGDVIHAEVYAKYWNTTATSSNLVGFATALTSAFGLSAAATGEALKAYTALNNYGAAVAGAGGSGNGSAPKAFITVLLFDNNFNFVDVAYDQIGTNGEQIGVSPKSAFDLLSRDVTIKEPGYAYVYVSNENPTLVDVFFDDVKITHTKSKVIQYNEYYPFGMNTQNSWTRENTKGNNFLYNGGTELNSLTGLYDLAFRNYDPVLGRMSGVDPMAAKYASMTPYNYAFNSPGMFNDPSGADPDDGGWTPNTSYESGAQNRAQQNLGRVAVTNSLNGIFRGGSMTSMFTSGWSPGGGSLSYGAFAAADSYFRSVNGTAALEWALGLTLAPGELHFEASWSQNGRAEIHNTLVRFTPGDFEFPSIDKYRLTAGLLDEPDPTLPPKGVPSEAKFVGFNSQYRLHVYLWQGKRFFVNKDGQVWTQNDRPASGIFGAGKFWDSYMGEDIKESLPILETERGRSAVGTASDYLFSLGQKIYQFFKTTPASVKTVPMPTTPDSLVPLWLFEPQRPWEVQSEMN